MSFTQREARRMVRQAVARVPEGEEIRHLNIMPMMDMMTILLVSFIAQAASSSTDLAARTVSLPPSLSDDELPTDAATLVITRSGIVVSSSTGSETVVTITNGQVNPAEKEGGMQGLKIPRLTTFLANIHDEHLRNAAGDSEKVASAGELLIVADRTTPYRTLIEVMFSAKQKEAGYKRFRLIVQKSFPTKPPG